MGSDDAMSNAIALEVEAAKQAAYLDQMPMDELAAYVARRAIDKGWDLAKFQDELAAHFLSAEESA